MTANPAPDHAGGGKRWLVAVLVLVAILAVVAGLVYNRVLSPREGEPMVAGTPPTVAPAQPKPEAVPQSQAGTGPASPVAGTQPMPAVAGTQPAPAQVPPEVVQPPASGVTSGAQPAPAAVASQGAPAPTVASRSAPPASAATGGAQPPSQTAPAVAQPVSPSQTAPGSRTAVVASRPAPAGAPAGGSQAGPQPKIAALTSPPEVAAGEPAPAAAPGPAPSSVQGAAPAIGSATVVMREPVAEATEATSAPSFDVVRVGPGGSAVIAGRATPGARVKVMDRDRVIAETRADSRGEWVAVPKAPLAPGTRELALVEETPGNAPVPSREVVVLSLPKRPGAAETPLPGAPTQAAPETPAQEAPAPGAPVTPPGALAVLVPRGAGQGQGSRVLQAPGAGVGIQAQKNLSLDTVEYGDKGAVSLSGRGEKGDTVNVYVDDRFVGSATIGEERT